MEELISYKEIQQQISKALDPLRRRVSMAIGRAVLSAAADDAKTAQTLQADFFKDETLDDLERFQNYGFTSVPKEGAEAIAVFPNGNRDHGVIIAVEDRRYRLKGLAGGEVAMYTDEGDKIHIKRGGTIEVVAATKLKVDAPAVELGAAASEAVIKGNTFQALFNAHTHNGNLGAPTGPVIAPLTGSELSTVSKTE